MTLGTRSSRSSRQFAAPRRRFRSEDDAGYLGDAPILLNLPSLCGVPDLEAEEEPAADVGESSNAAAAFRDAKTTSGEGEASRDPDEGRISTLAKPEFLTSHASSSPAPEHDEEEDEEPQSPQDEMEQEEDDDEDLAAAAPAAQGANIHRRVITWTALFVAAASLYLYVNRDRPAPSDSPLPAVDIDMGWDTTDTFTDSGAEESPTVDFAEQLPDPVLAPVPEFEPEPGPEFAPAPAPQPVPSLAQPIHLPELTEAMGPVDLQQQPGAAYPSTSTPEALYQVSERPATGDTPVGIAP